MLANSMVESGVGAGARLGTGAGAAWEAAAWLARGALALGTLGILAGA